MARNAESGCQYAKKECTRIPLLTSSAGLAGSVRKEVSEAFNKVDIDSILAAAEGGDTSLSAKVSDIEAKVNKAFKNKDIKSILDGESDDPAKVAKAKAKIAKAIKKLG